MCLKCVRADTSIRRSSRAIAARPSVSSAHRSALSQTSCSCASDQTTRAPAAASASRVLHTTPTLLCSPSTVHLYTSGVLKPFSYTALTTQCGGELAGLRGALVSPNYPSHYPARASCTWAIHVPGAGNAIALRFTDFQLEPPLRYSNACLYDALEVLTNTRTLLLFILSGIMPYVSSTIGFEAFRLGRLAVWMLSTVLAYGVYDVNNKFLD